jgi:ankyrin repeat protein
MTNRNGVEHMFTTIDSDKQVRTTTPIRGALVLTFVLIIGALLLFILIWAGVAYANPADDLYLAAGTGKVTAVRKLLNQGVDPNAAMDKSGVTALMQAAMTGDTDIVKLLLNKGANVNARAAQLGTTALMNAAAFGDVEMVRLLIDKGADINTKDTEGLTALSQAKVAKKDDIINLLKSHGAKDKTEQSSFSIPTVDKALADSTPHGK